MKRLTFFVISITLLLLSCDSISVSRKNDSDTISHNDEQSHSDSDETTGDSDPDDESQTDDESETDNESETDDKSETDNGSEPDDESVVDNESEMDDESETDDENQLPDNDENFPDDNEIPDEDNVGKIVVTVGTYNLENFFDTECDTGTDINGDCYDFFVLSVSEFNSKLAAVETSIRSINSDIQILVEIEDNTTGDALLNEMSDIYDEVYITPRNAGGQNVGVLTKGTIEKVVNHGNETDFVREFAEIHISYLGHNIIVFPAHFKAKSNDDPARRLREATKAAEIINEVADMYPDSLIVLAGDLNDEPGSDPLNALDSASLLRTASDIPLNDQCTYNYNGCSKIDHIYLSLDGAGEYVTHSSEVIKDGGCGSGPYCLGDSDHAALKAEFYIGEDETVPDEDELPDDDVMPEFSTIYDIKTGIIPSSTDVLVKGIVTAVDENSFFIQTPASDYHPTLEEKYSAVFVYVSSSEPPSFSIPDIGDLVEVTGTTGVYYDQTQIYSVTDVSIKGSASLPPVLYISPSSVRSAEYEAVFVDVGNVTVTEIGSYGDFIVTGGLYVDDDIYHILPFPEVGEVYNLKGVIKYSFEQYRLLPRSSSDVEIIY
jgi:endonuclease/exonuclease/phosphatase family metal-dependent hydrolase